MDVHKDDIIRMTLYFFGGLLTSGRNSNGFDVLLRRENAFQAVREKLLIID